jgi:pimeloyl-ACP methyl ester carboxylesterase
VRQQQQLMPDPADAAAWIAGYSRLDLPVLVLWGSRDRVLDPALGARLCRLLPHARLEPLPGVGHAAQLEAPDLVLQYMLAFLRTLPP